MLEEKSQGILLYRWSNILMNYLQQWVSLMAQLVKNLPTMSDTRVPSLGWEDLLEKRMATQISCQENSMDRRAQKATVHGVTESYTTERLTYTHHSGNLSIFFCTCRGRHILLGPSWIPC